MCGPGPDQIMDFYDRRPVVLDGPVGVVVEPAERRTSRVRLAPTGGDRTAREPRRPHA